MSKSKIYIYIIIPSIKAILINLTNTLFKIEKIILKLISGKINKKTTMVEIRRRDTYSIT